MTGKKLYDRIDRRVDKMMQNGLVDEGAPAAGDWLQTGYGIHAGTRLQGDSGLPGRQNLSGGGRLPYQADTRHFAKRQLTWFRRERDVVWIDRTAFDGDEEKFWHT